MPEIQIRQLTPTKPASEQNGKDCTVSLALERIWIRRLPEAASSFRREPVSESHAQFLDALHTSDTGGQFGAKQASIGGLVSKTPNSSESPVDCSRRELPVLKVDSVPGDNSLVEGQSGFGAVYH
jgi:hypothetical protein